MSSEAATAVADSAPPMPPVALAGAPSDLAEAAPAAATPAVVVDAHAQALAAAQALADAASVASPMSVGVSAQPKRKVGPDGRQHQRANVAWKARILLPKNQFLEAKVVDISEMGCGLDVSRSFPIGVNLTMLMAVPDLANRAQHHILKMVAVVRFQVLKGDAVRMGMQLMNLDPEHRRMLAEWVARGNAHH
jgi:hypothetical protein